MVNKPTKDMGIDLDEVELFSNVRGSVGFVILNSGGDGGPGNTINNPTYSIVAPLMFYHARNGRVEEYRDRRTTKSQ
jgi:hypothetical protein